MRKKDIKITSFVGGNPKISVAVYASAGEIACSFSSAQNPTEDSKDYGAKPSSPIYNVQNTAVALAKAFPLQKTNFLTIAVVNPSTTPATGHIEIASHTGGNETDSKAELDEALTVPAGSVWTYHIFVNVTF